MNEDQRVRLFEHQEPDHECTPYNGGCSMPHYRHNAALPNWLQQWPVYSEARGRANEARDLRDWGGLD